LKAWPPSEGAKHKESLSSLQTSSSISPHRAGHAVAIAGTGRRDVKADVQRLKMHASRIKVAMSQFMQCEGHRHHPIALLQAAISQDPSDNQGKGEGEVPSNKTCEILREKLSSEYNKAFVELVDLKHEYDLLANSTACEDGTEEEIKSRKTPLHERINTLTTTVSEKITDLTELRPRLENANDAQEKLEEHVKNLEEECSELPETASDLDKVRETITAMSLCPGLSKVEFNLPKWTGTWVTFEQDAATMSDKKQDELMDALCKKQDDGARAAEVSEIEQQSVEGIPLTNTAGEPLLGTCPSCAGDENEAYVDKHSRKCWNAGKGLNDKDISKICGKGLKAVLCVVDQGNIRSDSES